MAFRKSVYRSFGGLPPLNTGEDRSLVALAEAKDYRIRYSAAPVVRTFCRKAHRTDGGAAGGLGGQHDVPDPPSDRWLEPAQTFYLRYALRGALRSVWPVPEAVGRVLSGFLGSQAAALREGPEALFFGAFIQQIEGRAQLLIRVPMCHSDCRRELPLLQSLLAERIADPGFDPSQRNRVAAHA